MAPQQHECCSTGKVMPELSVEKLKVGYKVDKDRPMPLFLLAFQRIDNECHNKTKCTQGVAAKRLELAVAS